MANNNRNFNDSFFDKRVIYIYIIVVAAIFVGATYALQSGSIALNITTANIGIDEEAYDSGEGSSGTIFDSNMLDMVPIIDTEDWIDGNKAIEIGFVVGGAEYNDASEDIIYDIALVNLNLDCTLLNEYFKWRLIRHDGDENILEIFNGSFSPGFDSIKDGRLVLTDIQKDLPNYNSTRSGYHYYTFYMWLSDPCQESDISVCVDNGQGVEDISHLMGRTFSGRIEVELYTASKKAVERTPSGVIDYSTCQAAPYTTTINYKKGVQKYEALYPGIYKLSALGGAGGGATENGGGGGFAQGSVYLNKGDILYIVTGGVGSLESGGYNGGGNGGSGNENVNRGYGGGGATHIALTDRGVLTNYSSYTSDLLMVAGGGGGKSGAGTGSSIGEGFSSEPLLGGHSESDGAYDVSNDDSNYFSGNAGKGATTSSFGIGGVAVEVIKSGWPDGTTAYSGGGGGGGAGFYGGGGGAGGHIYYESVTSTNNAGFDGAFGRGGNAGDGKSEEVAYHPTAGGGGGGGSHYFDASLFETSYVVGDNFQDGYAVIDFEGLLELNVTFDPNGGTVSDDDETMVTGSLYGELPVPKRTGYDFVGWYTESEEGTLVSEDAVVTATSDHTLYARWEVQEYLVTFVDVNTTMTVTYGDAYGALPEASKVGYSFEGWYTAATGGTLVTSDTIVTKTKNHRLYPRLVPIYILVTFNPNGGTVSPTSKTVTYNLEYGDLPTPTKTGNDFSHWSTATSGGQTVTANTIVTSTGDHTLYAIYNLHTYIVSFDCNGGGGSQSSQTKYYGQDLTLADLTCTAPSGKKFDGWGEASNSTSSVIEPGEKYTTNANKTYYAIWKDADSTAPTASLSTTSTLKKTSQTATLKCSDSVGVTGYYWGTSSSGGTYTTTAADLTALTGSSGLEKTVSAAGTYYLFCTDAAGNVSTSTSKTYYTYTVNNLLETVAGTTGTYTSANYTSASSSAYLAPSGTSLTLASIYTAPTGSSSSTFKGYSTSYTTTAASPSTSAPTLSSTTTYYMWFNRTTYTLTLSSGTGVSSTSGGGTYKYGKQVSISATMNSCYNFSSWTVNSGNSPASTTTNSTTVTITKATKLTAAGTVKTFSVTLNKGTGISSVSGGGSKTCGSSVTVSASVSSGYTWSSWSGTYSSTSASYTFTMPASNVTLTANAKRNAVSNKTLYSGSGGVTIKSGSFDTTGYSSVKIRMTASSGWGYYGLTTGRPSSVGWTQQGDSGDITITLPANSGVQYFSWCVGINGSYGGSDENTSWKITVTAS